MVDEEENDVEGDSEVDRAIGITPAVLLSSIGGLFPLTVSIVSVRSLVRAIPAGPLIREADGDDNGASPVGALATGLGGDGRNGAPAVSKVDMVSL